MRMACEEVTLTYLEYLNIMKILHTSDWHLGHTLYNYDRTEEQLTMLEQITSIVADEQPDVMLVCGDVYHTPQTSAAVQTMFTDAMVKMHKACPSMIIVVTAGNHDSGTKHEIFRTPWRALGVYAIGTIDKEHLEDHIIDINGKGWVVAVPYCHERNLPEEFFQKMMGLAAERNTTGKPIVMTAHTTVKGCDTSGHDNANEYTVGGIEYYELEQMGKGYDYLALGHIHHAQFVMGGHHKVRYSGTPIPVNFDENYNHSVSIVNIGSHGETPKVKTIEITTPKPLVTLPTTGYASWEEAKTMLKNFPSDIKAYIRLNVHTDNFLPPEANTEAHFLTEGKKCRFCLINTIRNTSSNNEAKNLSVEELKKENPIDIVRHYAEYKGITFDEEMEKLFNEAVRLVEKEAREG